MTSITDQQPAVDGPFPVIVAGAGPVGMTLALDLARRGTPVLILDASDSTTVNPRCNTTNARSMEYFRRLGLADTIRRAGLPGDHATDVVYCTSLTGHELTRFRFSSSDEVFAGTAHEFKDWPTPEPQHRVSQIFLEPILNEALHQAANVDVRRGHEVVDVSQSDDLVSVTVREVATGQEYEVTGQYAVGCDGGSSLVRRSIGAQLQGDGEASERRHSIYFRSSNLGSQLGDRPGWMYWWYGPNYRGSCLRLDGDDLFLCHAKVPRGSDPEAVDTNDVLREALGAEPGSGPDSEVDVEILSVVRWTARRLVADRFRRDRILLAGDAAHLWLPLGGFGMNTGVADAMSLSWRLHAVLAGWAGDRVLDDYTVERHSVGEATSRAALKIDVDMSTVARDAALRDSGPEADEIRASVGRRIEAVDRQQWFSQGVQFGAKYVGSPGVAEAGSAAGSGAIAAIDEYVPSVDPGARVPHHWRPDGSSLFDHLGEDFTLLVVNGTSEGAGDVAVEDSAAVDSFRTAAADLDVPLVVLPLDEEVDTDTYGGRTYVLVRPDHVVAWSGDRPPADPNVLFSTLLGRSTTTIAAPATTRRTA